MVIMGGRHYFNHNGYGTHRFGDDAEWNFGGCGGAIGFGSGGFGANGCGGYDELGKITSQVLELWPSDVPIEFVGFEIGVHVQTGMILSYLNSPVENPCRRAYEHFCLSLEKKGWCNPGHWGSLSGGRASWDPMAVVHAVHTAGLQSHESCDNIHRQGSSLPWLHRRHGWQWCVGMAAAANHRQAVLK